MCSLLVRYDERRLERAAESGNPVAVARLERAWPPTSRDNALIGLVLLFGPLAALFGVFFYFFRTRSRALWPPQRWSFSGTIIGVAAVVGVLVVDTAILVALALILRVPLDE